MVETSCLICGSYVPLYGDYYYPMICDECRKRLKAMLYSEDEADEAPKGEM